eukprot:19873-Heterococcus_DN1.PRE.3
MLTVSCATAHCYMRAILRYIYIHHTTLIHSNIRPAQLVLALTRLSINVDVLAALNAPNDAAQRSKLQQYLTKDASNRLQDWGVLVGADGNIIAEAYTTARQGEHWSPANLVADTLLTSRRYSRIDTVPHDDWMRQNVTASYEKENSNLAGSKLIPSLTTAPVSVRWVSQPVWKTAVTTGPPDAVLIAGVALNGKTIMMEKANLMTGRRGAYSAMYSWTQADGFILVASVQMTNGTNSKVDIPLPNTKLLEVIRDRGHSSKDAATDTMQIDGIHYLVSARCASPNMYIDAESGRQFETELWNGETKCVRVLVQAMPKSTVKSIEISALQWQYIALAQQLLKAIALVFISLRAFNIFTRVVSMNASSKKLMINTSNRISATSRISVLTVSQGTSARKLTVATPATTATGSLWPATVKAVMAMKKEAQQLNISTDTAIGSNGISNANTNSHRYSAVGSGRHTPLSSPPTSPTATGSPTAVTTGNGAVATGTAAADLPSTLNRGMISTIDEITTFPFKGMYSSAKIHVASPADSDDMACRTITSTSDSVP